MEKDNKSRRSHMLRLDEKEIYEALMSQSDEDVDDQFDDYEIVLTKGQKYGTARLRGLKHVKVMAMICANRDLPPDQQRMLKHLAKPERPQQELPLDRRLVMEEL